MGSHFGSSSQLVSVSLCNFISKTIELLLAGASVSLMGIVVSRLKPLYSSTALGTLLGLGSLVVLWSLLGRKRQRLAGSSGSSTSYQDISVPEALYTLLMALHLKVAAAGALGDLVYGEVQVLEEILDQAQGTHVPIPSDGRNLFTVLTEELSSGPFDGDEAIAMLFERCTAYDLEWDDEDEWNEQVMKVQDFLKKSSGSIAGLSEAKTKHSGNTAALLGVVLQRLAGDKKAQAKTVYSPPTVPEVLSMNTRMFCAVCNKPLPNPVVCPKCKNTCYFSEEHLQEDAARHSMWCFEPRSQKAR